jgi:hypothetical protein
MFAHAQLGLTTRLGSKSPTTTVRLNRLRRATYSARPWRLCAASAGIAVPGELSRQGNLPRLPVSRLQFVEAVEVLVAVGPEAAVVSPFARTHAIGCHFYRSISCTRGRRPCGPRAGTAKGQATPAFPGWISGGPLRRPQNAWPGMCLGIKYLITAP